MFGVLLMFQIIQVINGFLNLSMKAFDPLGFIS